MVANTPKRIPILHLGTFATKVAKVGHYLIKTRWHCLSSFMAEPRSLNDCTACCMQASQVSAQPGDQSRSGILRGTIDKLPKSDERFANNITY